jgi:hypothetical protein
MGKNFQVVSAFYVLFVHVNNLGTGDVSPKHHVGYSDVPVFPADNQFPNWSETQIAQSNLIHYSLSTTQLSAKSYLPFIYLN